MRFRQYLVRASVSLISKMPLALAHRMGSAIGYAISFLPIKPIRVAKINIQHCFPELNSQQQTQLLRASFREFGKSVMEVPKFWILPLAKLLPLIKQVSGEAAFLEALNLNKGIIILGSHMGAEELLAAYFATKVKGTWIYRPQRGYLEAMIHEARQRFGAVFVPTNQQGVRALFKAVAKGELIGMSCDHNAPRESGEYAPFFNVNTWTMTLAAKFAQKTHAAVFLVYMERLAHAQGYHLHFVQANEAIYNEDMRIAVASMNQDLEKCVRQIPSQYQWLYKRFRTQPEGSPEFYY